MTEYIVDAAWDRPSADALIAAGYSGIMGYVSQGTDGKNITRPEIDAYHAKGLAVGINYEYNPESAKGGAARGLIDANIAISHAQLLGVPTGVCIWFSVDWDVADVDKPAVLEYANAALNRCAEVGYRAGIYAGYWVCLYLNSRGYRGMYWQTYAWSGGNWFGNAAIRQIQNDVTVGGMKVDRNQIMSPDWGQWKGEGMEQTDAVIGSHSRGNSVGDVLADAGNYRDWWYLKPGSDGNNPPPPGSRADILYQAAVKIRDTDFSSVSITQEMLNVAIAASAEAIGAAMAREFAKHVTVQ